LDEKVDHKLELRWLLQRQNGRSPRFRILSIIDTTRIEGQTFTRRRLNGTDWSCAGGSMGRFLKLIVPSPDQIEHGISSKGRIKGLITTRSCYETRLLHGAGAGIKPLQTITTCHEIYPKRTSGRSIDQIF
jgi:hypothetical protein